MKNCNINNWLNVRSVIFLPLLTVLVTFIISACKKDSADIPVASKDIVLIWLNNNLKILRYQYIDEDTVREEKLFSYQDNLIEVTSPGDTSKVRYYLNTSGFADSSVQNSYNDTSFYQRVNIYTYNSDFYLIKAEDINRHIYNGAVIFSNSYFLTYQFEDNNLISITTPSSCSYLYTYSQFESKVDPNNFYADIIGRRNKNLPKSEGTTCHGGPSTVPGKSDYSYVLDSKGFVTQKTEIYTSSYHYPDGKPTLSRLITHYYYIFE